MLRKVLIGACLSVSIAGCASAPPRAASPTPAAAQADPACTVYTGSSRILPTQCAAIGNSYNQEQIQTTGKTNAQEALRRLDPSVTLPGR